MIKKYNFYNLSLSITITFNKKILNEKKKKNSRGISKFRLQHHQYYKKHLDKIDPMTSRKFINGDPSGSHLSLKTSGPPSIFG
jgi:hypothetical protein